MCKNICKRKERGLSDKKIYEGYMAILLEHTDIVFVVRIQYDDHDSTLHDAMHTS
jgi:hypothetical protein